MLLIDYCSKLHKEDPSNACIDCDFAKVCSGPWFASNRKISVDKLNEGIQVEDPEDVIITLPRKWAGKLYDLIAEDYPKTQAALSSNVAKRDFKVFKRVQEHYDTEDHVMHQIEKQLGFKRKK